MSDSEDNESDNQDDQIQNGHLPDENPGQSYRNSGVDLDQFDIDLPTTHRYLGKLKNVGGYTFYTDGEVITLAALQTNTLVFPGFTLPLVINNDLEINTLQRHTRRNNNSFVLLTPNEDFQGIFTYGTIMEIIETHIRNSILYIKARSRQCCRLVEPLKPLMGEVCQVTVRALLEPPVPSPIHDTQLLSLRRCRPLAVPLYRKFHLSQFAAPSWILDGYEIGNLSSKLIKMLRHFYLLEFIPEDDPVRLSYWFVQNFQLKHSERLRILTMASVAQRLRFELELIQLKRLICCLKCNAEIAKQSNVFPMSKDGVQSNYCNPQGYVFETVTVSKATNYNLFGAPSTQFSWFPGYSWTIMQCKMCGSHLGWKFASPNLKPESFFGLAKSGFDVTIIQDGSNTADL